MDKTYIKFCKMDDVSISELMGKLKFGVYVLWDNKSKIRSSYIGEGNMFKPVFST